MQPSNTPIIDNDSSLWLENIEIATRNAKPCPVPEKYFIVLKARGYIDGSPSAAKLMGTGMGVLLLQKKQAEEAAKTSKRSSKRKK